MFGINLDFAGLSSSFATGIQIILGVGILAVIALILIDNMRYKTVFIGSLMKGDRKVFYTDKIKEVKTKDGVKWRFKKLKKTCDPAPEDCHEITAKGKTIVSGVVTKEKQVVWRYDRMDYQTLTDYGFVPIPTQDRQALRYEIQKANQYTNSFLERYMPIIANGFVVIMILAIFMIFFGRTVAPTIEYQELRNAEVSATQEMLEELRLLRDDVQILKAEGEGVDT